jgi:hypothetical protein
MGQPWRDCIVTLIDLVGIRKLTQRGDASKLMRELHKLVLQEKNALRSVTHAYAWNDSVLLMCYVDGHDASFEEAIRDADRLKHRVDQLANSYAIAVKGQTFPPVRGGYKAGKVPGVTVIRASSWAMANCFEIEKRISSKLRKPWYIDGRIKERIRTCQTFQTETVPLLPMNRPRTVYVFDGYLWGLD